MYFFQVAITALLYIHVLADEELFPDISCRVEHVEGRWNDTMSRCWRIAQSPLDRPCPRACMLEHLGFIIPPIHFKDGRETTETDYTIFNINRLEESKYALYNFTGQFSDDDEGVAAARKVFKACGEIMNQTVVVDKKNCEEWGPIYDCIQNALCPAEPIWPYLSCRTGYKHHVMYRVKAECDFQENLRTKRACFKGCMLKNLGIYRSNNEHRYENLEPPRLFGMKPDGDEVNDWDKAYVLEDILSNYIEIVEPLKQALNESCTPIFEKVINEEKRTCEEWTELYDCIEKAVGCADKITIPAAPSESFFAKLSRMFG